MLGPNAADNHMQENFLQLLKQLFRNQAMYLDAILKRVLCILFECRSDGAAQVSGAADDALFELCFQVSRDAAFFAILELLNEWDLEQPDNYGLHVRYQDASRVTSPIFEGYQPMVAVSALQILGKIVRRYSAADLTRNSRMKYLLPLLKIVIHTLIQAVNSTKTTLRKAAIDCLTDLASVLGDDVWTVVDAYLNPVQKKLLGVFYMRAQETKN